MPQARQLRRIILPLIVGHAASSALGLAFVSVSTLIVSFLYVAILYSIYMTLHTWLVWVYMVLLGFNIVSGLFNVWLLQGVTMATYLVILVYYVLAIIKIYYDSLPLRSFVNGEEDNFYFAEGIRHMVNNAKEEYNVNRNP